MSSLAFFLLPHHHHHHNYNHKYSSIKHGHHFQHHLLVFPLQSPCKVRVIRTSKFDFNPPDFNDDDDDDLERTIKKRRPRTKKRQVRWWSDDVIVNEQDVKSSSSLLEQLVDNLFILQVFKSYGLFLPIILLSFLIATGPKAFLMGSGVFFGLSIVIYAFQKLSEWLEGSPKLRKRRKKRSKNRRRKGVFVEEDDLVEESLSSTGNKKRQSWVARNNGSFYDKDSISEVGFNNFGGWDDLVGEDETSTPQKPFRETERLENLMEKQRLSRSMDERDLPLLLKIMIAVFPFLASWTNDLL